MHRVANQNTEQVKEGTAGGLRTHTPKNKDVQDQEDAAEAHYTTDADSDGKWEYDEWDYAEENYCEESHLAGDLDDFMFDVNEDEYDSKLVDASVKEEDAYINYLDARKKMREKTNATVAFASPSRKPHKALRGQGKCQRRGKSSGGKGKETCKVRRTCGLRYTRPGTALPAQRQMRGWGRLLLSQNGESCNVSRMLLFLSGQTSNVNSRK